MTVETMIMRTVIVMIVSHVTGFRSGQAKAEGTYENTNRVSTQLLSSINSPLLRESSGIPDQTYKR